MDKLIIRRYLEINDLHVSQVNDKYDDLEIVEAIATIAQEWQEHMALMFVIYQLVRRTPQGRSLCEQLRHTLKESANKVVVLPTRQ